MFKLIQNGPEGSDCTAPYIVELNGEYTVEKFIQDVLLDKGEWGYIGIAKSGSIFGDPRCTYSNGKLESKMPDNYMKLKVVSAKASGGWSRMDYYLNVEIVNDTPFKVTEHYCVRREDIFGGSAWVVYRIGKVDPKHAIAAFRNQAAAINECKYLERLNAKNKGGENNV